MRKRRTTEARLWAPTAPAEPCLLRPAQLDYPTGLIGEQRQSQPTPSPKTAPAFGSCQKWERAVLGAVVKQPLTPAISESPHSAGERYLSRVWMTYRAHFGQSSRPVPGLVLTEELRADTLAQYLPDAHVVKVRPSALSRHALVHECCHAWTTQHHGTDFAAGMLHLLQHEFGCARDALLAAAQSMRLRITD